eukprot:CAMPEP_0113935714 /NCGR_PEP_ID=MMETSP1339-20121228/2814_1 /TAXON_ID=94617 /ORGANISM="Fibrocapsa japonica" /LENGTH=162 /DNA_ID=CAMNT_0000937957 /DNA_START=219 /DNA_END=707 /DNA_ORIENTATION=+ /assembly_acc=CAM_ASM_000762
MPRHKPEGVERIQGYRYPAPGARRGAVVPHVENEDDLFDIGYYKRDTRRMPQDRITIIPGKDAPKVIYHGAANTKELPAGSPGRPNPAVERYDPSGLRSSMTATHAALAESLEKYKPNHLVKEEWADKEQEIVEWYTSRGLPPVPGRPTNWAKPADWDKPSW